MEKTVAVVGYARVSTVEQVAGFEAQVTLLKQVGCERVFEEKASAISQWEKFEAMLDWVRDGDVVVVTTLSRLARSMDHFVEVLKLFERKQVSLRILDMSVDTGTAQGKLMLNMVMSFAQFERELMLERQKIGIAKAKAEGRYRGRKPTARAKSAEIVSLAAAGVKRDEIARRLKVGVASVYRVLAYSRAV